MADPDPEAEQIARYLLGDVSDQERNEIAERSLSDEAFGERVERVEFDLIERYARGEMPDHQRQVFERYFLVTEERRRQAMIISAIAKNRSRDATRKLQTIPENMSDGDRDRNSVVPRRRYYIPQIAVLQLH